MLFIGYRFAITINAVKQNIFQANETAGSLVIILQAGRLLVCRQADF